MTQHLSLYATNIQLQSEGVRFSSLQVTEH